MTTFVSQIIWRRIHREYQEEFNPRIIVNQPILKLLIWNRIQKEQQFFENCGILLFYCKHRRRLSFAVVRAHSHCTIFLIATMILLIATNGLYRTQ